jgi:hypothetical protein
MDEDTINQENAINYRISLDEKETKKKIFEITNHTRRQSVWNQHFAQPLVHDDSWMLKAKVF